MRMSTSRDWSSKEGLYEGKEIEIHVSCYAMHNLLPVM